MILGYANVMSLGIIITPYICPDLYIVFYHFMSSKLPLHHKVCRVVDDFCFTCEAWVAEPAKPQAYIL